MPKESKTNKQEFYDSELMREIIEKERVIHSNKDWDKANYMSKDAKEGISERHLEEKITILILKIRDLLKH